ncbi:uncharacterized protein LOC101862385 isoform X2 [Aplysia californica]|uniref:Uncharacterized protein LOC101862385 isoform X2 n=1 Tax=Aplysia californica TaxID=6500 RepID=A0ABM0JB62_APLCA|nr:uncharacterized protein LOC101862385 isoform X2 [Aplysia californica]
MMMSIYCAMGMCRKTGMCKSKGLWSLVICLFVLGLYTGFQVMYTPVHMRVCPDPIYDQQFYQNNENITIVTMYLNIGSLTKTSFWFFSHSSYTTDTYKQWLISWGKLNNKVIAFFDDDAFITQFRLLRSHLPESHTKVIKINRYDLPAFKNLERVKEVVKNPSFKVSYPPEYTCVMNAKYDALDEALKMVDSQSEYIAWMDIGLFRRLEPSNPPFILRVPPGFNSSKVGVSEVTARQTFASFSPEEIYEKNIVWVAGGYILAHRKVLPKFISAYRSAVDRLLDQGLADTDQQVLASMYSPPMAHQQEVTLSTYSCPRGSFGLFGHGYLYFCLPYICKESAECHKQFRLPENGLSITPM